MGILLCSCLLVGRLVCKSLTISATHNLIDFTLGTLVLINNKDDSYRLVGQCIKGKAIFDFVTAEVNTSCKLVLESKKMHVIVTPYTVYKALLQVKVQKDEYFIISQ